MKEQDHNTSGRKFIQYSGVLGAGVMLAGTSPLFSQTNQLTSMSNNIKSKGYAGNDEQGKLTSWNFERRAVSDNDVLISIKYSTICHSDIHTIRGHWGRQAYPQVPGHEIAGIVMAVGRAETNKFPIPA